MKMVSLIGFSALFAVSPVMAEMPSPPNAPVVSSDGSLYRQFGGHDGMVKIMDDLFVNIDADPRIKPFFEPAKVPHIKEMLVLQFCAITGGGCTYSGRDMAQVHAKLGIQPSDFNALVEDLQMAMDKNHVPFSAQNRLLAALAPQSRAIIYKPSAADGAGSAPVSK